MQQVIFVVLAAVFIFAIIRQILFWSWLWQLKEYRADRMRAHFQDIGVKSAFLALIGYSALRQNKIPKFTAKIILVYVLSFLSGIAALILIVHFYVPRIYLALPSLNQLYFLISNVLKNSADLLFIKLLIAGVKPLLHEYGLFAFIMAAIFFIMPAIIFLHVFILNALSLIFKARIISRAKAKIAKYPHLKVIGITGSYGKSITKEILSDILSKKYKVLKTPENINTAIGIAQLILEQLDESHEIFVIEMGAYKIGEIKEICDMVKPEIGIITAINEQHLALFGKIENTIKAKFELVDCLPSEGLAILNIGDANIQAGAEARNASTKGIMARMKLYSVGTKADAYAIGEACGRQSIKFKFISGADKQDFIINIAGCHNTSNIIAAVIAAADCKMDLAEISQILKKIDFLEFALKNSAGPNGSTLIDDTYNANPDGVVAALNHVRNQRGRKIIIMSSLIELGSRSHEIHRKLGKEISAIASKVFFLDDYYISDIRKGAAKNENSNIDIIAEKKAGKIADRLLNDLKASDIILFINRGAGKVLELLKK